MRTICMANQKGGVGKTSSVSAVGFALAAKGHSVLFVDCDSQRNLTKSLDPPAASLSLSELLIEGGYTGDAIVPVPEDAAGKGVRASILQGASDINRVSASTVAATRLRDVLRQVDDAYDYVMIDCPPSLGVMTVNAIAAADGVVIPTAAAAHSRDGVEQVLVNIADVRELYNPDIRILGILVTAYDGRATIDRMMRREIEAVAAELGIPPLPPIRQTKYVREAEWLKRSIFAHAPRCTAALDYAQAAEMIRSRLD